MNSKSSEQVTTKNNSLGNRWVKTIIVFLTLAAVYFIACIILQTSTPIAEMASNSMQPTLSRGDIVLLRGSAPVEIRKDDIITFNVSKEA